MGIVAEVDIYNVSRTIRGLMKDCVVPWRSMKLKSPLLTSRRRSQPFITHSGVDDTPYYIISTAENQASDIQQPSSLTSILPTAVIASAVLTISFPPSSQAKESFERRHHRRIEDGVLKQGLKRLRSTVTKSPPATDRTTSKNIKQQRSLYPRESSISPGKQHSSSLSSLPIDQYLVQSVQQAYQNIKKTIQGETVYSIGINSRNNLSTYYNRIATPSIEPSPLGWIAASLAVSGLLYLILGDKIAGWLGMHRRQNAGGKWVRDRSLGGKLIFIPDNAADTSTGGSPRNPLAWSEEDESASTTNTLARGGAGGAGQRMQPYDAARDIPAISTVQRSKDAIPSWWVPPSTASAKYVSKARKEELLRQAKSQLKALEDAKLLQGQDFPLSGLVTLRMLCNQAGDLQVRCHTDSGRDSLLRAAVRYSMDAAVQSNTSPSMSLGGYTPAAFIAGIAHDVGTPDQRAITIAHAEAAAACRAAAVDAEAAFRSRNEVDFARALHRIMSILLAIPLPEDSPEAEMLGRSLQRISVEIREQIFVSVSVMRPQLIPLIGTLMGFEGAAGTKLLVEMMSQSSHAEGEKARDEMGDGAS